MIIFLIAPLVLGLASASATVPRDIKGISIKMQTKWNRDFKTVFKMETQRGNPYEGGRLFLNPMYRDTLDSSILTATKKEKIALRKLRKVPTAVWLDSIKHVRPQPSSRLSSTLFKASCHRRPPLVTFVIYNLPNRDCAAEASAGKICCSPNEDGTCDFLDTSNSCEDGLRVYEKRYIDRIASSVKKYCGKVPMAFVIEPDSLPNLVTNLGNDKCRNPATQASYKKGIKLAVHKIAEACPQSSIYLDAAHGGWLGWEDNSNGFAELVKKLSVAPLLHGFAVNVANYQEMGIVCPEVGWCNGDNNADHECCKVDSCGLAAAFNPGHTILNYVLAMKASVEQKIEGFDPKFIVDTSRNGIGNARADCGNWCNIRKASVGLPFTTETAIPSVIDAYLWVKPPGESDGCTEILPGGETCPRFDSVCASEDAIGSEDGEPRAPEAGNWFDYQIKRLVTNGNHEEAIL